MNENEQLLNDPAMVEKAFDDPEIRKLPLNSSEFNAALTAEPADDKTEEDDDAPAGADEQDDGIEEEVTAAEPKKPGRKRDQRIDELTKQIGDLKRSLEQRQYAEQHPVQHQTPDVGPKPQLVDFDNLADFTEALADWKYEARKAEDEQAQALRTMETQAKEVVKTWEQREKEVRKNCVDYNDVVNVQNLTATNPSNEARLFLGECDDGPRVIYTLLSDPELTEKFTSASPTRQVALLAKVEAALTPSDQVKKTIATKAPEPPRSLPSGKSSTVHLDVIQNAHEMSFEEWDRKVTAIQRAKKRA